MGEEAGTVTNGRRLVTWFCSVRVGPSLAGGGPRAIPFRTCQVFLHFSIDPRARSSRRFTDSRLSFPTAQAVHKRRR